MILAACYAGRIEDGEKAVAPLRALGQPIVDILGPKPFTAWQQAFDPLLAEGARNYWKSHDFTEFPDAAFEPMLDAAAALPDPQTEIVLVHLGGAMARVADDATPFPQRAAHFTMNLHTRWDDPAKDAACIGWARDLFARTAPFAAGSVYVNFMPARRRRPRRRGLRREPAAPPRRQGEGRPGQPLPGQPQHPPRLPRPRGGVTPRPLPAPPAGRHHRGMPGQPLTLAGATLDGPRLGGALVAAGAAPLRRRPPPREVRAPRPPRRDAAPALRDRRDARPPGRRDRRARPHPGRVPRRQLRRQRRRHGARARRRGPPRRARGGTGVDLGRRQPRSRAAAPRRPPSRRAPPRPPRLPPRRPAHGAAPGEVSGHYHPKLRLPVRGGAVTRPCFLLDATRLILPAFGVYTGGLFATAPPLARLLARDARAILTGSPSVTLPVAGPC